MKKKKKKKKKMNKKIEFARRVEMRAAELIQRRAVGQDKIMTRDERNGMFGFRLNSKSTGWHAGQLLLDWIVAGNLEFGESTTWAWDPTRPVAEQYPKRGA